ncbi:MAG: transglutaminase-like cysteine peptidase [Rhodobacteraceae bacterium]|nr:transglutaminase-like cysteine peptidase [Paracoccaceae bacterium]
MTQHTSYLTEWLRLRSEAMFAALFTTVLIAAVCAFTFTAQAAPLAPTGYANWCATAPTNCADVDPEVVEYSNDLYFMMRAIQRQARWEITWTADPIGQDNWWYPIDNKGDCDNIAIYILEYLLINGVPRGAIRFAAVLGQQGRNHAWVEVMTSKGTWGLDANNFEKRKDFLTATHVETHDCDPRKGCEWRSNTLLPTRTGPTEDRTAP